MSGNHIDKRFDVADWTVRVGKLDFPSERGNGIRYEDHQDAYLLVFFHRNEDSVWTEIHDEEYDSLWTHLSFPFQQFFDMIPSDELKKDFIKATF